MRLQRVSGSLWISPGSLSILSVSDRALGSSSPRSGRIPTDLPSTSSPRYRTRRSYAAVVKHRGTVAFVTSFADRSPEPRNRMRRRPVPSIAIGRRSRSRRPRRRRRRQIALTTSPIRGVVAGGVGIASTSGPVGVGNTIERRRTTPPPAPPTARRASCPGRRRPSRQRVVPLHVPGRTVRAPAPSTASSSLAIGRRT